MRLAPRPAYIDIENSAAIFRCILQCRRFVLYTGCSNQSVQSSFPIRYFRKESLQGVCFGNVDLLIIQKLIRILLLQLFELRVWGGESIECKDSSSSCFDEGLNLDKSKSSSSPSDFMIRSSPRKLSYQRTPSPTGRILASLSLQSYQLSLTYRGLTLDFCELVHVIINFRLMYTFAANKAVEIKA